jgi:sulfate adenylyltransferase subunit 1 (EFTu-like GTPase family)
MKDKLRQILMQIDLFKPDFKEYVQDECIDLENRWELFLMGGHLFADEEVYIEHFKCLDRETIMFDEKPFYPQRTQRIYTKDIVTTIAEVKEEEDYDRISKSVSDSIRNLNIDDLKEEILQKFLWSFGYDW